MRLTLCAFSDKASTNRLSNNARFDADGSSPFATGDANEAPTLARLSLDMSPQPDDTTCGPTCLHAVYRYFGDELPLDEVIKHVVPLPGGGTLAVTLANHALRRGYSATIHTYNLQLFDPTWFDEPKLLSQRLKEQRACKSGERFGIATDAYLEFLELGGKVALGDHTSTLIRRYLKKQIPILTGLSATHLYRCAREYEDEYDSVRGEPQGHFVVLSGYNSHKRRVMVADPLGHNPTFRGHYYAVDVESLVSAIMLGILTYDANLLVIRPPDHKSDERKKPDTPPA